MVGVLRWCRDRIGLLRGKRGGREIFLYRVCIQLYDVREQLYAVVEHMCADMEQKRA